MGVRGIIDATARSSQPVVRFASWALARRQSTHPMRTPLPASARSSWQNRRVIPWLGPDTPFPPLAAALDEPNGLLAASADLTPKRLAGRIQPRASFRGTAAINRCFGGVPDPAHGAFSRRVSRCAIFAQAIEAASARDPRRHVVPRSYRGLCERASTRPVGYVDYSGHHRCL